MCKTHTELSASSTDIVWHPDDLAQPTPSNPNSSGMYRPEVLKTIETKMHEMNSDLRALSLGIHSHPEIAFEEVYAHNAYTTFMEKQGFEVTREYCLKTAWKATFTHGSGGRTIGLNSEMDALPGVGHACGHNLIGMAGVAIACALRTTMEKYNIPGKIILLGTPAEEGGSGKVMLLEKDAYKGMDVCLMCHPAPGPIGSVSLSSSLALQRIIIEYKGHTAHAALSPWEGTNALDAAVLAYNNIAVLRQQLHPTYRVHGIIEGKDWAPNVIPDYAKFVCYVRAPTRSEMEATVKRVVPCFEAAALATGCEITKTFNKYHAVYELRQNKALGSEVANVILDKYGAIDYEWGIHSASTDFGNVSYALPSLHPGFAIPTVANGGNHTVRFADSAATEKAHYACLDVSKALASTAIRVLTDDTFFAEVRKTFEEDEKAR